ncbi:hypothetical protein MPH_07628 [Macrophomina phaseolina MS6]|uniref:Zn(2)-C6 fungal-type transcription factor mpsE n=1 Tax=Macrophomina phaseolina (strain MS6) TaxID=1126212 RepID=MPSE_MACPH|nr:RecName: Full=Zn(2)-C6 fungal-type transcription factor mpsE; AltName: Full=Macrophasetins biosynthesis cluster protein E [Macrophomina phaseolina MS6]EKG15181.1 hypothetical protein MPH_07628 [Macrophomina phaseolina MS6]
MAENNEKYRSFRLACDRCRSHKLKCPQQPSTATGACQRCTRAKAQCTFSPRSRAIKNTQDGGSIRGKAIKKPAKRGGSQSPSAPGSPPPTATENPPQQQQSDQQKPSGSNRWDSPWGPLGTFDVLYPTPQAAFPAAAEVSPSDFSAAMSMGSTFMDCSPFAETSSGFDFQFDMDHPSGLPYYNNSTDPSLAVQSGGTEDDDVPMASTVDNSRCHEKEDCTKKLSCLAVEFQRHLALFNKHSTSHGGADKKGARTGSDGEEAQHWLSTYPIGEILCLSGDFSSILEPELYPHGRAAPVSIDETTNDARGPVVPVGQRDGHHANLSDSGTTIGLEVAHAGHPPPPHLSHHRHCQPSPPGSLPTPTSRSSTAAVMDTPTALLILNCYVSMIRIYSALFAHLHAHLRHPAPSHSSARHRHSRSTLHRRYSSGIPDPALKFGELPPAPSDDVSLRAYTAVRLLLDALQRSEELLGLPADLRCASVSGAPVGARDDDGDDDEEEEEEDTAAAILSSDSEAESLGSSVCVLPGGCGEIIGAELARAVFRQEAQMGSEQGGGGLEVLRRNIAGVKRSLRQRMAL